MTQSDAVDLPLSDRPPRTPREWDMFGTSGSGSNENDSANLQAGFPSNFTADLSESFATNGMALGVAPAATEAALADPRFADFDKFDKFDNSQQFISGVTDFDPESLMNIDANKYALYEQNGSSITGDGDIVLKSEEFTQHSIDFGTPQLSQQQNNPPGSLSGDPSIGISAREADLYESARKELAGLKFGPKPGLSGSSIGNTRADTSQDATTPFLLPPELANIPESIDQSQFRYCLTVSDVPQRSRVETQIKIKLHFSPSPPEYLLHFPHDTIPKSKFQLAEPFKPSRNTLMMETYVVGTKKPLKSLHVCPRCVKREQKRASRKKNYSAKSDEIPWKESVPRRAIIFNCKEVLSFPPPPQVLPGSAAVANTASGVLGTTKSIEVPTRLVCYCRHHDEEKGFRVLFIVKDHTGTVVAMNFSAPIMIMDKKKGSGIATDDTTALESSAARITPPSPASIEDSSSEFLSTDFSTTSHASKKRKSNWSPSSAYTSDTGMGIALARRSVGSVGSVGSAAAAAAFNMFSALKPSATSPHSLGTHVGATRIDPLSPLSDARPGNVAGSSASSRRESGTGSSPLAMSAVANSSVSSQPGSVASLGPSLGIPAPAAQTADGTTPMIQRIIPAQGPVRGGIEVTLLGTNFHQGLTVMFGDHRALTTNCWSESTVVTYLPPAAQAGQVLVTFEGVPAYTPQVFTYVDDSDRQLVELALQIVGLKMNGKLEDAKNIARRIIDNGGAGAGSGAGDDVLNLGQVGDFGINGASGTSATAAASDTDEDSSEDELNAEEIEQEDVLLKIMELVDVQRSRGSPNWHLCNNQGQSMMHLAAGLGYKRVMAGLISRGSKVDMADVNGVTPLHFAALHGRRACMELLLHCRADPFLRTKVHEKTAMDIADSNVLDLLPVQDDHRSYLAQRKNVRKESSSSSISSLLSVYGDSFRHVSRMVHDTGDDAAERCEAEADGDDESWTGSLSGSANEADDEEDGAEVLAMSVRRRRRVRESQELLESKEAKDQLVGEGAGVATDNSAVGGETRASDDRISLRDRLRNRHMRGALLQSWRARSSNITNSVKDSVSKAWMQFRADETELTLPRYDDLFPGRSQRSISDKKQETAESSASGCAEAASEAKEGEKSVESSTEEMTKEKPTLETLFAVNRVDKDRMLVFFWIPVLIAVVVSMLLLHFNAEPQWADDLMEQGKGWLRSWLVTVMLGNERMQLFFSNKLSSVQTAVTSGGNSA